MVELTAYEVVLSSAAKLFMLSLGSREERSALAVCLREELDDGPNAGSAHRLDSDCLDDGHERIALPLSFNAIVAIYRSMTRYELEQLGKEKDREVARSGYLVFDLLPPELGFYKLAKKTTHRHP